MKKLSAKAISSPARTDKFPPPLMMRFLRTNAGSRSSRRSRSSPMFVRKKNSTATATAVETQEPSSPKVTCMGQVRAKRSSKPAKRDRASAATPCRCWWIRKPNNPCRCRPVWPKWAFLWRKPTKIKEDSAKSESNFQGRSCEDEESEEEEEEKVSTCDNNAFESNSTTPPRNALLLTRCRSAPFRSSSLANKFWGSSEETESTSGDNETKPDSVRQSISDSESKRVSESETNLCFFKELEDSLLRQRIASITDSEGNSASRPVMLTRCKSEPARRGYRLDPEVNNLWKKRRLGFAETCSVLHMVSD